MGPPVVDDDLPNSSSSSSSCCVVAVDTENEGVRLVSSRSNFLTLVRCSVDNHSGTFKLQRDRCCNSMANQRGTLVGIPALKGPVGVVVLRSGTGES